MNLKEESSLMLRSSVWSCNYCAALVRMDLYTNAPAMSNSLSEVPP